MMSRLATEEHHCQREQGKITPLFTIENEQLARHGTLLRRQKTPDRIWDGFKMKYHGSNTERCVA
jgi:hypothetical protein